MINMTSFKSYTSTLDSSSKFFSSWTSSTSSSKAVFQQTNSLPQVRVEEEGGPWNFAEYLKRRLNLKSPEHLVLLDVGMVAELTREDQLKFVDFFKVGFRCLSSSSFRDSFG